MLKIMIAVDGSEPSLDAVHHAISLVRQGLQAHFVLAHVQQEASLFELATQDSDMIAAASVDAGMHLVAPAVALVRAAGISYEVEIGLGEPAAALADIAESTGCEQIIIGALGQGGLPQDVAEAVAWLGQPGSGAVNGQVLRVCGQAVMGA